VTDLGFIGFRVFAHCDALRLVALPVGLEEIRAEAFVACEHLSIISFPNSLRVVSDGAFQDDRALECVVFGTWPHGPLWRLIDEFNVFCGSGGDDAALKGLFEQCCALTPIFEMGFAEPCIESFGDRAFSGCWRLDLPRFKILTKLKWIGDMAFADCMKNKEIWEHVLELPPSCESIGQGAFFRCGVLRVRIGSGLVSIGAGAFEGSEKLVTLSCEHGKLRKLDSRVFDGCTALKDVTLPISLYGLGTGCFAHCTALVGIVLPGALEHLGECAFEGCSAVKAIKFPESLRVLGPRAFAQCSGLENIEWSRIAVVRESAFEFCVSLSSIALVHVSEVDARAFLGCGRLASVDFPEVVSIGSSAFEHCDLLARVELPDTLLALGNRSFACCPALSSIELGGSLKTAGSDVFVNSSNGASLIFRGSFVPPCVCEMLKTVLASELLDIHAGELAKLCGFVVPSHSGSSRSVTNRNESWCSDRTHSSGRACWRWRSPF
jgi:hypothetical protein